MATAAWLAAHPKLTLYPPKSIAEQISEYGKAMGLKPSKAGVALWVKALELVMPPAKRSLPSATVSPPPALTTPGVLEMGEESPAFRDRVDALETQVRDLQTRITALPLKAAKEIGEESRALMERMATLETQIQALQARISSALSPNAAQENSSSRTESSAIAVPEAEQIELWTELDGWEAFQENRLISERSEEPGLEAELRPPVEVDQVVPCLPAAPAPRGMLPAGRRKSGGSLGYPKVSTSTDEGKPLISLISELTAPGFQDPKTAAEVVRFLQARWGGIEAVDDLVMICPVRMEMFDQLYRASIRDLDSGDSPDSDPGISPHKPELQLKQPAAVMNGNVVLADLGSGERSQEPLERSQRSPNPESEHRAQSTQRELPPQPRSSHEGAAPPLELPPNPPTAASNGSAVVSDPSHQEILKEQPERSQTPHPEPKQRSQPIPRKSPPQQQSSSSKHAAAAQLPKQKKKKKGFWGLF